MNYYLINPENKYPIKFHNRECVFLYLANRLNNNENLKEKLLKNCSIEQKEIIKKLKSLYSKNYKINSIQFILDFLNIKVFTD